MTIIAYIPSPVLDEFWIGCSKEEAEKWFVPLLDENRLEQYNAILRMNEDRRKNAPQAASKYEETVMRVMGLNQVDYAYFCVTRDLPNCYAEVAHYPFHQFWYGDGPFSHCDHVTIESPDQLSDIVMTYRGKSFEISKK